MARSGIRGERPFIIFMLMPAFFFLIMFYIYPTLFNLQNSFTDLSLFGLKKGGEWVGIDNYVELFTSGDFRRVLFNTVVWLTIIGVTVRIVLGLGLALLLELEGSEEIRPRHHQPGAAPGALGDPRRSSPSSSWRWLLHPLLGDVNKALLASGVISEPIPFLSDAFWVWPALITIITWNTLPLVTLTFLASLQSLPHELIEAAEVDGATKWQKLRYVIIPHLKPAIIVMVLLSTFWTFNKLRLCLAHHRSRARSLHQRHGDRGLHQSLH